MQEYKTTTIQSRSFAEKTLTYHHEIALQTLVVNLPSREMPSFSKCTSLKEKKYPSRAQKSDLTRRVSVVLCQNEDKTSVTRSATPPNWPRKLAPSESSQGAGSEARFLVQKRASCPKTHLFCFFE